MGAYRALSVLAGALFATTLTACAVVDTVDPRYDTVNRASAKARNESILLNIVRASKSVPLNFIAFSKVGGQWSVGAGVGAPNFLLGPLGVTSVALSAAGAITGSTRSIPTSTGRDAVISDRTFNASTSVMNNFDITLLETKDFYNGLLAPVDLPTVNFFVRQGYSRELLFWLFAGTVRETIGGRTYEYRNDPDPAIACEMVQGRPRCFKDVVELAMASGLAVQIKTVKGGGGGSKGGSKKGGGGKKDSGSKKGGGGGGDGDDADSSGGGKSTTAAGIYGRLCFDPVFERRAKIEYPDYTPLLTATSHRPRCDKDPWQHELGRDDGENDTLAFEVLGTPAGRIRYDIATRSIFGIYQFLGRLLETHTEIHLADRTLRDEDDRLLAVSSDTSGGCFTDVGYEGAYYCVPRQGAETTKRIFSLLAQLIALRTQSQDLAITPTVRTIQ